MTDLLRLHELFIQKGRFGLEVNQVTLFLLKSRHFLFSQNHLLLKYVDLI